MSIQELQAKLDKVLKEITTSGFDYKTQLELRKQAREMCMERYQENYQNAMWWKDQYQKLLAEDTKKKDEVVTSVKTNNDEDFSLPPV